MKLQLSIPTTREVTAGKYRYLKLGQTFHAVLQNVGKKPLAVFLEGNSWGDEALTLEFRKGDKKWVARFSAGYTANGPATTLLEPDEVYSRTLKLTWDSGSPQPMVMWGPLPPNGEYELRAIYRPEPLGRAYTDVGPLWTGEAASPPILVKFEGFPVGS